MRVTITQKLLGKLKPESTIEGIELTAPYEIRDTTIAGFLIRVQPSGARSYVVQYARGKRITLGPVGVMLLDAARERARQIVNAAKDGRQEDIGAIAKPASAPGVLTLRGFVTDHYLAWMTAHTKRGKTEADRLVFNFDWLADRPLPEVTRWAVEKWRSERIKLGRKPATVNRIVAPLLAALNRAVEWGHLEANPLAGIKPLKQESGDAEKVRYLTAAEEHRLRLALIERDERKRQWRESGNAWRRERGRDELPAIAEYGDALPVAVLLALNTGMRRGELLSLAWESVDLARRLLTIRAATAKAGKTRHIPLNREAVAVLSQWRKQTPGPLVFPGRDGSRLKDLKKAWRALLVAAGISRFRWHDMRHHFASRLVMMGIDLNTVRELLGHADLTMTLRYAHLAPQHLAAAVERLGAPAQPARSGSRDPQDATKGTPRPDRVRRPEARTGPAAGR